MNTKLQSVRVRRFKGVQDASFDAAALNVLIGANNSGKSSLAQAVHFAIGLFQAISLANRWGTQPSVSVSLSPSQLLYSPCEDLYALGYGGQLLEGANRAIQIELILDNGQKVDLSVRKGRNGNILVDVDNVPTARSIGDLAKPFTIYSPGLAGIARREAYVSDGVLLRTIARGDANLVFRNLLLRLSQNPSAWNEFLSDLKNMFPDTRIQVSYREKTDEVISVTARTGSHSDVPVELAGTGLLQAVQILSYVHYFHPSVIVLDEPDSHLHPNNQRILCKVLQVISEERDTQVFLTTHSRHVVDALGGQASFLWVRQATIERLQSAQDITVLLDIGALDVTELLSHSSPKCIVLTEDALTRPLAVVLESSGFSLGETLILAYHGCTEPHNLRPLLELIRNSNSTSTIVVHRDRDYLTDKEVEEWEVAIRNMQAEPFVTTGVDIESHFLDAAHLSQLNGVSQTDAEALITTATAEVRATSIEKYVNGRVDIARRARLAGALNYGALATEATNSLEANVERFRHSKTVLGAARRIFQSSHGANLRVVEPRSTVASDRLVGIAKKLWP